METTKIIQKIKKLYKNIHGYSLDSNDSYYSNSSKNNDLVPTYGEILPNAVTKLINNLEISKNDMFVDLGCGTGKVVLQFHLQTPVHHALDIEFSTTRHKQATSIFEKIKIKKNKKIECLRGNFLNLDLSKGTIFYSASTCFSDNTMKKIWNKLMQNKKLNSIIVLKDFPKNVDYSRVKSTKELNVGCSWAISQAKIYYFK